MRKKFVYFVLIPFGILLLVVYLFIDRWVEWGLESAGEKIVGAKVEIDNLKLSLSPIAIQFSGLQVANPNDPWKNLFETGLVRFALNFGQVLRGKILIETMEVNNLILGTRRTTDGSLHEPPNLETAPTSAGEGSFSAQAGQLLAKATASAPVFDLDKLRKYLNVDSLVNVQSLHTMHQIDSLKDQVQQASQQWQASLADVEQSKKRLTEIETSVRSINVNELKSIDRITGAISTVDNAYKGINAIRETFQARQSSIAQDVQRVSSSVQNIDDVIQQDFNHLMSMAHLPDVSVRGIAQLVVGKGMMQKATRYLYWVDFARKNVPKYTPKPDIEKPPRLQGQDIRFPEIRGYPKLWIQKILVSGGTDQAQDSGYIYMKGEVHDISSDQKLAGKPLTVALSGTQGGTTSLAFTALFDRRKDVPLDDYKATIDGLRLSAFELGQSNFLPSKITDARLNSEVHITVPGEGFDSNAGLAFHNMTLVFPTPPHSTVERLAQEVLQSVKGFDIHLRLWKAASGFDIALTTDLDDQIASRIRGVIGDEIAKLRNDLKAKLEKQVADKRQELDKLLNAKRQEVDTRVKAYQDLLSEKTSVLDAKKKELTDRLQQQKGKAEETLKGLFKKK